MLCSKSHDTLKTHNSLALPFIFLKSKLTYQQKWLFILYAHNIYKKMQITTRFVMKPSSTLCIFCHDLDIYLYRAVERKRCTSTAGSYWSCFWKMCLICYLTSQAGNVLKRDLAQCTTILATPKTRNQIKGFQKACAQ